MPSLLRSLNSSGSLVAPLIQGSIMITLPPGVVSLKLAGLNHCSSALPCASTVPANASTPTTMNERR